MRIGKRNSLPRHIAVPSASLWRLMEFAKQVLKHTRLLFILHLPFYICHSAISQNLVFNPGFESDSGAVIHDYSQKHAGVELVNGWFLPTDATSDYYNSHQSTIKGHPIPKAKTGQGRIAMILGNEKQSPYREFITGHLTQPLEKNKKYRVSFYVCRYKYSHFSPMQIGVYMSADSIVMPGYHMNMKFLPRVKMEDYSILEDRKYWHKVEGIYLADGGERFITIGNFKQTINDLTSPIVKVSNRWTIVATAGYAYCFIDDVTVEEYNQKEESVSEKKKLFLYLIDHSTSMKANDKLEKVKKGLEKSIRKLPQNADYSIITFSDSVETILKPTSVMLYDMATIAEVIVPKGKTNADRAVSYVNHFSETHKNYDVEVIMCTDGQFTLKDTIYDRIINGKTKFNLMQLGGMRNAYLENLMNKTGGTYIVSDHKSAKEDIVRLSSSIANDQPKVEYTKANKGKVLLKYALLASLIAIVIFAV